MDRIVARLLCTNGVRDFRSGTRECHGEVVWFVNDKGRYHSLAGAKNPGYRLNATRIQGIGGLWHISLAFR